MRVIIQRNGLVNNDGDNSGLYDGLCGGGLCGGGLSGAVGLLS